MNAMSPNAEALARVTEDIDQLGLSSHLLELESQGFTTIKGVLSDDAINRAQAAILDRVEKDTGKRIDAASADDDDDVGMARLVEARRYRAGADGFQQRRHRRGMTKTRAVIDIVAAEARAHQLLEKIGFLV